jgi:pilus assembly protein CpaE
MTIQSEISRSENDHVLVFDSSSHDVGELQSVIKSQARITARLAEPLHTLSAPLTGLPNLVIIHCDTVEEVESETIRQLRADSPDLQIVVISNELPANQARFLLAQKVQDWLVRPTDTQELITTIRKSIGSRKTTDHKVHAVISTAGGAGATTVALAMAGIASKQLAKRRQSVALFDLDFSSGSAGQYLNMRNDYNLGAVSNSPQRVDQEFIKVIQKKYDQGFFLYSFLRPELNTEMNGYELVLRMLDAVTIEHPQTFLDIPYYETEWRDDVLTAINSCSIVTELNPPSLKHTMNLIERIKRLRQEEVEITVLVNKCQSSIFGQRIGRKKLEQLLGAVPIIYLPLNIPLMSESLERGISLTEVAPRTKFAKILTKYMKKGILTEKSSA